MHFLGAYGVAFQTIQLHPLQAGIPFGKAMLVFVLLGFAVSFLPNPVAYIREHGVAYNQKTLALVSVMFALAIILMQGATEFLYFQF